MQTVKNLPPSFEREFCGVFAETTEACDWPSDEFATSVSYVQQHHIRRSNLNCKIRKVHIVL